MKNLLVKAMEGGLAFLLKGRDCLPVIRGGHGQHLIAERYGHADPS